MGSWIGGDRDGNPFVTAEVMRGTLRMQSSRVLRFYLEELHALGAELSLAAHLADVSEGIARARRALARPRRIEAASPIGWRCPASMRGSPRPR
jgi:phosphoenolpyruvate carboxylase